MAKPLGEIFHQRESFPFTGFSRPKHQFQQGGLAAAVGTDNGHEILLPDGKVHILKYGFSIIGKIKISWMSMIVIMCPPAYLAYFNSLSLLRHYKFELFNAR
jgi:hypothetical protein